MSLNVISLLVENKPGVLFNISNTIRRKNFNIHSITAIAWEEGDTSRITITSMLPPTRSFITIFSRNLNSELVMSAISIAWLQCFVRWISCSWLLP